MKDIVERLRREARVLSLACSCDKKGCRSCRCKKLIWETAREIEELRSLKMIDK